ncbi:MAG: DUF2059 domain-containing protein, partial [Burkholderiaceae bacterium]
MNKSIKVLAAAALLAVATAPQLVLAQATSTPAASSPAKKELVKKLLQLQQPGVELLARQLLQQPVQQLLQGAGAALQQVPADKREAVAKEVQKDVTKFGEETGPLMRDRALKLAPTTIGPILEERFSEDELRQIVTWFESPVSKKFADMSPEMQKALADKLVAETKDTVSPRLKALE